MARTPTISDDQILNAARKVFLLHGFAASTAEVAQLAGVSQGSLFKRYPTKEALFFAAMNRQALAPIWTDELDKLVGQGDLRETLIDIGVQVLNAARRALPPLMIMWSMREREGTPDRFSAVAEDVLRLTAFLQREMDGGRLRPGNAAAIAYSIMGTITSYAFFEVIQGQAASPARPFVEQVVGTLWAGIGPTD